MGENCTEMIFIKYTFGIGLLVLSYACKPISFKLGMMLAMTKVSKVHYLIPV